VFLHEVGEFLPYDLRLVDSWNLVVLANIDASVDASPECQLQIQFEIVIRSGRAVIDIDIMLTILRRHLLLNARR